LGVAIKIIEHFFDTLLNLEDLSSFLTGAELISEIGTLHTTVLSFVKSSFLNNFEALVRQL
jgi:hypothetical protein